MKLRLISLTSKQKVYHKDGCPYVAKISKKFKKTIDIEKPEYKRFRPCKYCGGMRGWAKIFHKRPNRHSQEKSIDCWYDDRTGYIFMKTKVSLWKVYWKAAIGRFLLFHKNGELDPDKSNRELMRENFHRQRDVSPTPEFDSLVNYIVSHDRNKEIANKDYRKLPQKTKKQKKIYRHYSKKAKRDYYKRMDELFDSIKTRK